jgi:hypothetical protein
MRTIWNNSRSPEAFLLLIKTSNRSKTLSKNVPRRPSRQIKIPPCQNNSKVKYQNRRTVVSFIIMKLIFVLHLLGNVYKRFGFRIAIG